LVNIEDMGRNVFQYKPTQKITYTGGKATYLQGMEDVIRNLNIEIGRIRGLTQEGLFKAMEHVHRKAEPATPVRTGALISSWFVVGNSRSIGGGFKLNIPSSVRAQAKDRGNSFKIKKMTKSQQKNYAQIHKSSVETAKAELGDVDMAVIGGYSVPYAGYIHESIAGKNKAQNWSRPGSHAWWLQEAFNGSRDEIMKIIIQNIKR
jgi:hypothetical protein